MKALHATKVASATRSRALFVGAEWPEPRSSAAGRRATNVLEILQGAGWDAHFASAAARGDRAELPEGVQGHAIALNDSSFDEWVGELAPEVVVFDRFFSEEQFGWRARERLPQALLVLDTVDLHFVRRAREKRPHAPVASDLDADALRELASILRCDLTWVVSDFERDLLVHELGVPDTLIDVSRILYRPAPAPRPLAERVGFATIGTFRHSPNADAVRWLHREIWPRIRARLPQAELRVYGAYLTREFSELHDPTQGFLVEGYVDDATEALSRARATLAPLRFGAGIKGKILDSWWAGTPVVTTPVGAEGMHGAIGFPGLVTHDAADADAIADAAVRLAADDALWREKSAAGLAMLRARHDFAEESARAGTLLKLLRENLAERRARHWLGRLLHMQGLRSTEYFSRWIEAKSRGRDAHQNPISGKPTEKPTLREK